MANSNLAQFTYDKSNIIAYKPSNPKYFNTTIVAASSGNVVATPSHITNNLVANTIIVNADAEVKVTIKFGTTLEMPLFFPSVGGIIVIQNTPIILGVNEEITVDTTASENVSITICGYEERP